MLIQEELSQEVVELTKKMVQIKSVNPPGGEGEMADFVENYLRELGIQTTSVPLEDGEGRRLSVVGRISGRHEGSVVLCGHLDTVGVTEDHWSVPAFDDLMEDGKIYGRGSADMKGGVAVILAVARKLVESESPLDKDVVLALTADEESDYGGAYSLTETDLLDDAELLVVTEPTNGEAYIGEKGELWVDVTFLGDAAHGSTPDEGINAVLMGAGFVPQIVEQVESFPGDGSLGQTTINVGQFEGGWQPNVVPDKATVKLDIRVVADEHKERALGAIRDISDRLVDQFGGGFETEVTTYQEPIVSETDDDLVAQFLRAAGQKDGSREDLQASIVPYCTDAAALKPYLKTPVVICGPGEIEMAHQPDEYVTKDSLVSTMNTFLRFFDLK
ncbi:M20 family metallopeptidase [Candidatus Bipolaricaulota bacterium]|nr:M20 family metallopeptidase [Candidatus Bipolaricaulota bacterium]